MERGRWLGGWAGAAVRCSSCGATLLHTQSHAFTNVIPANLAIPVPFTSCHAGIYDTLKECACISKSAGGIGLSMHNIRATGSYIRGTNGSSNGIVPMLRVFNDTGGLQPACSFAVV